MTKLVVSGCSFTNYIWPTWADYASEYFDEFARAGAQGADNATIARGAIELASPGDTVIVMWSGYDRWSTHSGKKWIHDGSAMFDKQYFVEYYSGIERFMTTVDYIQLLDLHAKDVGYNLFHFSAFPFFKAEFGVPEHADEFKSMYTRIASIENNYLLQLDLLSFQHETNQFRKFSHQFSDNETHPTPKCHWEFFHQHMAPHLNIVINEEQKANAIADETRVLTADVTPWAEYALMEEHEED